MIRKTVIVLLMLAAVATAAMWIDSYRRRPPQPPAPQTRWTGTAVLDPPPPNPCAGVGLRWGRMFEEARAFFIAETCVGALTLTYYATTETPTALTRNEIGFGRLRFVRGKGHHSTGFHPGRGPDVHFYYRLRELTVPFGLLLALFAAYPILAFLRGPLRRHYRRKNNLCLKCGYNLKGLTEPRCPECGMKFE